jgi:hypothetical protein
LCVVCQHAGLQVAGWFVNTHTGRPGSCRCQRVEWCCVSPRFSRLLIHTMAASVSLTYLPSFCLCPSTVSALPPCYAACSCDFRWRDCLCAFDCWPSSQYAHTAARACSRSSRANYSLPTVLGLNLQLLQAESITTQAQLSHLFRDIWIGYSL